MTRRTYRITASTIPNSAPRGRRSLYREIVEDFLARGIHSGRVEVPGHTTANVAAGLGGAVKGLGAPLRVCRRGDHAYLMRVTGRTSGEPHV